MKLSAKFCPSCDCQVHALVGKDGLRPHTVANTSPPMCFYGYFCRNCGLLSYYHGNMDIDNCDHCLRLLEQ